MSVIYHKDVMYGGGNGGGGASAISDLTDVELTNLADGQVLKYNATSQKWENDDESGGTVVIANPVGEPTDELETIQIGEDIFEIVGSGGGGSSFQREVIYSASAQADTYALSSPLTDFDAVVVFAKGGTSTMYRASGFFTTDELVAEKGNQNARFAITTDGWYSYFSITDESTLARKDTGSLWVYAIVGLKFGSGGSGGSYSTSLLYSNAGTSVDNITLSDDYTNYDQLYFECIRRADNRNYIVPYYMTTDDLADTGHFQFFGYNEYCSYDVTNATTFTKVNNSGNWYIKNIYGVKFGSGGGSESTNEIIPIESPTNTASRTFTFSKTPKKISMSYNTSDNLYFHWEFIWSDAFATFLAKPKTIGTGCTTGLSQITYGSDGKTFTITGSNAAQAANSTGGTGQIFVEY